MQCSWNRKSWIPVGAAVCLLAVMSSNTYAFKQEFHEQVTERELTNRGFDQDSADEVGDSNYYTDIAEMLVPEAHADNNLLGGASQRLTQLRRQIGDALAVCNRRAALDRLGEALHTTQDIFSHSNSVDNGFPIQNLLALQDGTAECSNSNLRFAPDGLVTGWFSFGFGNNADIYCAGKPAGACCHHFLNKDSPGVVNGARHVAALAAATAGTNAYVDSVELDIRQQFPATSVRMLSQLERAQRMVYFVIDTTGSMGTDIAGVKATVNAFLNGLASSDEAPTLGLATFKDSVNNLGTMCDVEALRNAVNSLFPSGGGDCPEASNAALLSALQQFPVGITDMQLKGGRIMLATDASAKDAFLGSQVEFVARQRGVSIDAILTGDCVAEGSTTPVTAETSDNGDPTPMATAFEAPAISSDPINSPSARTQLRALTERTGGVLFNVSRFEVDDVAPVLLDLSHPDVAVLLRRKLTVSGIASLDMPVDDSVKGPVTFMVTASSAGSLPTLKVRRPDGSIVQPTDVGVTRRQLSSVSSYTINAPAVGMWRVELAGTGAAVLRVFAATDLRLNSVRLLQAAGQRARPQETLVPLEGEPVAGGVATADLRFSTTADVDTIKLLTESGELLETLAAVDRLSERKYRAKLSIPRQVFVIETNGTTAEGNQFVRQVTLPVSPQPLELSLLPEIAVGAPGQSIEMALKVRNLGSATMRYRFRVDAEPQWQIGAPLELSVEGGETVTAVVSVLVPAHATEGDNALIRIFAESLDATAVRNNVSANVLVGPVNQPPECGMVRAELTRLWPPSGEMVPITLLGVTDPDGDAVNLRITQITQDEPVVGPGSGQGAPDGGGVGNEVARVRSERNGNGDGRVYEVDFIADDGNGGACTGSVRTSVPHDRASEAIDSGQEYDATRL